MGHFRIKINKGGIFDENWHFPEKGAFPQINAKRENHTLKIKMPHFGKKLHFEKGAFLISAQQKSRIIGPFPDVQNRSKGAF